MLLDGIVRELPGVVVTNIKLRNNILPDISLHFVVACEFQPDGTVIRGYLQGECEEWATLSLTSYKCSRLFDHFRSDRKAKPVAIG